MNRRNVMTAISGAPLVSVLAAPASTLSDDDVAAVRAVLQEYQAAWAASDADRMYLLFTEDTEWVNIVGMFWKGRAEGLAAHRAYLGTMFRGVPLTLQEVQSVRSLGKDVIVAVVRWSVGAFTTPGGDALPASEDRMTLVLVRTPDGLRIAQGANVQIDPFAARFDPVKMRSNAG